MLIEGERLLQLLKGAKRSVVLCAPFIKHGVVRRLFGVLQPSVTVKIVTRWRPVEIAAGVSDLSVFDLVRDRPHTELALLDNLHAKLYIADHDVGLVGSANLTAAALGWVEASNVEILLPTRASDPETSILLDQLKRAQSATSALKDQMEVAAAALKRADFEWPEGKEVSEVWRDAPPTAWLPKCAAPEKLFAVYRDRNTDAVVSSTREDAILDVDALGLLSGMNEAEFYDETARGLERMPAMAQILQEVPRRISDTDGIALVSKIRPELSADDARMQWAIVRDWIRVFFRNKFEVAADTFIVRPRTRL